MAKPMSAVSTISATCSHSDYSSSLQHQDYPARPPRRRRPRHRVRDRYSAPSSALLSLLATIAASSAGVNASPTPPSFLCPSLEDSEPIDIVERRADVSVAPPPVPPSRPFKRNLVVPRFSPGLPVPDRYERGDDGRWRRVDVYTLYGSTVCSVCPDSPSIDDQIQVPADGMDGDINITPTPTTIDAFLNTLPNGWRPAVKPYGSRTSLILALSLVLAFFICFFIIGCLFWRKSKRRKYRENDVEMRVRRHRRQISPDEGREAMLERDDREVRAKQKLWARATARWKANARYTARQRRGRRSIVSRNTNAQNSRVSLEEPHRSSFEQSSPPPSRPLSRRSSIISEEVPVGAAIIVTPSDDTATTSSQQAIPSSPPAYGQRLRVHTTHITPDSSVDDSSTSPPLTATHSRRPSHVSTRRPSVSAMDDELAQPTVHTGHVATDDKALLARLATLASAPPTEPSGVQSSAPELEDEEYETFGDDIAQTNDTSLNSSQYQQQSRSPSPSPLPPPPSKGKLPATIYDYSYALEDILYLEPESELSAPPFEETPSAPPLEDSHVAPSAPPMFDLFPEEESTTITEEFAEAGLGSHVDEDDVLSLSDSSQADLEEQAEDVITTTNTPSVTPSRPSSPQPSSLPVQGPIASDGTPPSYQP
ncbi:hypothetical protein AX16_000349 [Volvariella volvacea WC 439]|nr:hypothetical protein AX16_000349 [Volvariella volvacea WC 439]